MQKNNEPSNNKMLGLIIGYATHALFGVLVGIAVLIIFSICISNGVISCNACASLGVFAVFASALVSGFLSARAMGKAVFTGFIQSGVNLVVLYILGTFVFMRIIPTGSNMYILIACVAGSVLGGAMSAIKPKKRRRRTT